jgi:hypothetical protein
VISIDGKSAGLLERSSLYREFLAERQEILRHKWIESEKAGRDIGFEQALVGWMVHHRLHWRKTRRLAQDEPSSPDINATH